MPIERLDNHNHTLTHWLVDAQASEPPCTAFDLLNYLHKVLAGRWCTNITWYGDLQLFVYNQNTKNNNSICSLEPSKHLQYY
jgi:hypothetical protein